MNAEYPRVALPETNFWNNPFTGWGIWSDLPDSSVRASNESGLGLLLLEVGPASGRILRWAALFAIPAVVLWALTVFSAEGRLVFAAFALIFTAAALYRLVTWFLNKDLKARVFREGLSWTDGEETQVIRWNEIDHVIEHWHHSVYQAVVHIHIHRVTLVKKDGKQLQLDRMFEGVEQLGQLIQSAVMEQLCPVAIEQLKAGGICDFGAFKISDRGITHKDKGFLPWGEVKDLNVHTMGQTTMQVQRAGKWGTWASAGGGNIHNLHLFQRIMRWFIIASKLAPESLTQAMSQTDEEVHYQLALTKEQAINGFQKTLLVGPSKEERQLTVRVPAGVQDGATYRFDDHGRPDSKSGVVRPLIVQVSVQKYTDAQMKWATVQMTVGGGILLLGLGWLGFYATYDLITCVLLALTLGLVGGTMMSVNRRWLGAVSGTIGGLLSYLLQLAYYTFVYLMWGRDSFWNYEMFFVLAFSVLPGIGVFWLLTKIFPAKPAN